MKIGIAGVGGIGSNVAVNLVRSGISQFTIVDFDRVELTNLNRQFYFRDQLGSYKVDMLKENLLRIDPEADIVTMVARLDSETVVGAFTDCTIIVEGFDGSADKKMLLEAFTVDGRPIVSASGIAGSRMDNISCRRLGNCFVVGDFTTDCRKARLYGHKVCCIAAFMTDIILTQGGAYDR